MQLFISIEYIQKSLSKIIPRHQKACQDGSCLSCQNLHHGQYGMHHLIHLLALTCLTGLLQLLFLQVPHPSLPAIKKRLIYMLRLKSSHKFKSKKSPFNMCSHQSLQGNMLRVATPLPLCLERCDLKGCRPKSRAWKH